MAIRGARKCALHADPERAAQLGSKHGRLKARSGLDAVELEYKPLKNPQAVSELLEETINRVRQGSLDLRTANTIGFLAGISLRSLAQQSKTPGSKKDTKRPGIYRAFFDGQKQKVRELYPVRKNGSERMTQKCRKTFSHLRESRSTNLKRRLLRLRPSKRSWWGDQPCSRC